MPHQTSTVRNPPEWC